MPINRRINDGELINEISIDGDVEIPKSFNDGNYEHLTHKPSINGHELIGDKLSDQDLGIEILKADLTASRTVGGVSSGDQYAQGTTLEQVIRDILNPVDYPTLTNPSMSINSSIPALQEAGTVTQATLTIIFNRGSINPAYGTSGYRAGPAYEYYINGTGKLTNQFLVDVSPSSASFNGKVNYLEGEQPLDSEGNDYSTPLPAGNVTKSFNFEFAPAIWATNPSISTVSKQPLISRSTGQIIFDFPAQTSTNPEIFDIPTAWTVISIEVYNDLLSRFEDCSFEFDQSTIMHDDASGNPVNYIRYRDNRGYAADTRRIRVRWST